ncbi:uncharacterized protein CBL_11607 [Carabus blaptoides fortunei]
MGKILRQRQKKYTSSSSNKQSQLNQGTSSTDCENNSVFAIETVNKKIFPGVPEPFENVKNDTQIGVSPKNKVISKKNKHKLKRQVLVHKINSLNELKKQNNERRKRKNNVIIGDTNSLHDALPSLDSLLQREINVSKPVKFKSVAKSAKRKKAVAEDKKFLKVPMDPGIRKTWAQAVGLPAEFISKSGQLRCCEDHFDLEHDAENWMQYLMIGTKLQLKKNVIPHLNFDKKEVINTHSQISSSSRKMKEYNIQQFISSYENKMIFLDRKDLKSRIYVILSCMFVKICADNLDQSNQIDHGRGSKFFPFVGVVRFENGVCLGANNLTGTCYTRRQCARLPGVPSGTCARRIGVCCIVQRTCGATSSANNTYFINPGFPNSYAGGTRCTMTVQRCNSDICQLRLDFLSLSLAQPDGNGTCINDAMTITGGASIIPPICGENTGQHMYMDFNDDTNINIVMETSSSATFSRYWNIKATQIACECPTRAPSGCLQYYTELSGTVKSFNYGITKNSASNNMGTRQIANMNYGICIAMVPDYCSIRWSQTGGDPTSFTVSGDTDGTAIDVLGTPLGAISGSDCTSDFVVIPNPSENGVPVNTDRFCGNGFVTKTTSSKPFVLTVVTDLDEVTNTLDTGNHGFSLDYQQLRCGTRI